MTNRIESDYRSDYIGRTVSFISRRAVVRPELRPRFWSTSAMHSFFGGVKFRNIEAVQDHTDSLDNGKKRKKAKKIEKKLENSNSLRMARRQKKSVYATDLYD